MNEKIREKKTSRTIIHKLCPAEPQQKWKEQIEVSTEALTFQYPLQMNVYGHMRARTHRTIVDFKIVYWLSSKPGSRQLNSRN